MTYLHGKTLLNLGTAGKILNDPVDLGESDYMTIGNVGHMGSAINRHKMMLTMGEASDVFLHKHLVVFILIFKQLYLRHVLRVQATEYLIDKHFSHSFGGTLQAIIGKV